MKGQNGERSKQILGVNAFEPPVDLLVLFQEKEGSNGVWAQADEAGNPATEHPAETLNAVDINEQLRQALTLTMSTHDTSLDHIHRRANSCSDETGSKAGGEMGSQAVLEWRIFQD